jgi:DNA-binding transcriptional regulator YdaS (Cro superfamily)
MNKQDWFEQLTAEEKRQMAIELGVSIDWLYQIKCGEQPSAKLAARIHSYSKGKWSKRELRPDVFGGR